MNQQRKPDDLQAQAVRALAADACVDMFASFGTPVAAIDMAARRPAVAAHPIASFIGFTGPVRGSLTLCSSIELFQRLYPVPSKEPLLEVDVVDWAAEVVNQLLGRIKRRFCARGVDFDVSTPRAVQGREIGTHRAGRDGVCELLFLVGDHEVLVCLDVKSVTGGKLFKEPSVPIECADEGDLVVF